MVKGHNKSSEHNTEKTQGQDEHASAKERSRRSEEKQGRHSEEDQSGESRKK